MNWPTVPLKRLASIRTSNVDKKTVDDDPAVRLCNYTDVYYRDSINPSQDFMRATASPDQVTTFRLKTDDVIITKDSETADDIGVPTYVEASAPNLVCGYHLALIRPLQKAISGRFLFWAMASSLIRSQLEVAATGITRFGLRADAIGSATLALPPLPTQRAIADFLDAETARIDALISKKRRMLRLLEERFAAHVEQHTRASSVATDKGDSRPDKWRLIVLRRCFRSIQYGIGEASREAGAIAVLGMGNVDHGEIVGNPGGFVDQIDPSLLLEPGDLLFNRTNSLALVAKVALVRDSMATTFASYLVRLRTNHLANSAYLNYLLNTRPVLEQARSMALPSIGQANLNPSRYTSIRVPLPPVQIQRSIVSELDLEAAAHDKLSSASVRQIKLLAEHRQALITAAVTGWIEVPGVAAS